MQIIFPSFWGVSHTLLSGGLEYISLLQHSASTTVLERFKGESTGRLLVYMLSTYITCKQVTHQVGNTVSSKP